ncbi:hypothetical protein RhiirA1_489071 [Rhizophagus irregularis]|uniref:Uncharacterized protein n=4 Tax=Rhizophagus irregularis TaxID=588596 RepID=A0A2I1F268_9GLOM|nr:hypothetical protein GLOIN_2v1796112 [Rhizophagus irregularis DAOM 181602=DAOM 197198]PKC60835.1 hypothetical protein RhiirA1_489071 [Rhizophagus irregularis]PKY28466.1 hypothetical protein RhiirB3_481219 [Rhizophagus irregularis]POG70088.1 hypothetical protein GLOIN_2v1796112 [Rhizophagus irregularis DAOM 181602=DAOM 197198]|eukprot:XP_025176954.1 hypothetical protein GLOIN_2v1796112 [Rhizophagus irregularis DAOM 181602=DAOM 197198]
MSSIPAMDIHLVSLLCLERKILFHKTFGRSTSPPMTGKTSLGQLFEDKLLKLDEVQNGSACVFRISLAWMQRYAKLMGMSWDYFLDQFGHKKVYLIIDEVQKIYRHGNNEPHHGGGAFWNAFKLITQCLPQLFIVELASYGHFDFGAYSFSGNRIDMDNKWGYEEICFTKEEFHDYFYNFCKVHINDKLIKDEIPCPFNYVSDITAYHPGLVA